MRARERRDYNKYNCDKCKLCRAKNLVTLKSGKIRCNNCGKEA